MARQFLIGELGSTSYSSGKLADTGLDIQVLDVSNDEGPVSYDPESTPNPDMFRIVQGTTSGPNVYSNWMNPRNVIVFDGSSYESATASTATLTIAGDSVTTSGQDGLLHIKLAYLNGDVEEFYNFTADFNAGGGGVTTADTAADVLIGNAWDAIPDGNKPDWVHADVNVSAGTTVVWSGVKPGDTTNSGGTWDKDASNIQVSISSRSDIATAVYTTAKTAGDNGVGTYYSVKKFEDKMKGIMYGYYNRRDLPNTPDNGAVVGSTYDMITIVATKDGSAMSGQIHGVDNLDEVFIAGKVDIATISGNNEDSFVSKLNELIPLNNIGV